MHARADDSQRRWYMPPVHHVVSARLVAVGSLGACPQLGRARPSPIWRVLPTCCPRGMVGHHGNMQ